MRARLKHWIEVVLWFWLGRPTSKMKREWAEKDAKRPPHPKPGRVWL